MKALAIIPCKADSARLPRKNFQAVGARSLVGRAVDVALQAKGIGLVDDVLISYDQWDSGFEVFAGQKDLKPVLSKGGCQHAAQRHVIVDDQNSLAIDIVDALAAVLRTHFHENPILPVD